MKSDHTKVNEITRRLFVERMARSAFGLSLLPFVPGQTLNATEATRPAENATLPGFGKAKAVIMLQLSGGLSQIDSFDPKTGASKGPGSAVSTKGGCKITDLVDRVRQVDEHAFAQRLAIAPAFNDHQFLRMRLDPVGDLQEQVGPGLRGHRAPRRRGLPGCLYRQVDVLGV